MFSLGGVHFVSLISPSIQLEVCGKIKLYIDICQYTWYTLSHSRMDVTSSRWWTWRHRQFWIPVQFNGNLISIWNFTNTVMKNVKWYANFKSVEVGIFHLKSLRRYLRYFRGTHWWSSLSRRLLAFYTWVNRVTDCLYAAQCRSRGIGEWLKRLFCGHGWSCPPSSGNITGHFMLGRVKTHVRIQ